MTFIQSMDFATEDRDGVLGVLRRWSDDAVNTGTAQRAVLSEDRGAPGRFVLAVWFESAETAAENSERPETGKFAEQFGALCSDGPAFREFDVVEVYGE
jgi:quinol monooxygenase YgiN